MVPLQWKACNILFSFLKRQDKPCKHSSRFAVFGCTSCVALSCPSHPLPGNTSAFLLWCSCGALQLWAAVPKFCTSLAHCNYGWSDSFLHLVWSVLILRDIFGREIFVKTYQNTADLIFNIKSNVIIVFFSKWGLRSFNIKANLQNLNSSKCTK